MEPLVGIQVGAISFADEGGAIGTPRTLDLQTSNSVCGRRSRWTMRNKRAPRKIGRRFPALSHISG